MPLCTVHLLSLHATTPNPLSTFLLALKSSNVNPLVISRVIRWIILPTILSTDALLAQNIHWDLLLVLPSTDVLPDQLSSLVQHEFTVTAGVPSRLLQDFAGKNMKLLHPDPALVPGLEGGLDGGHIAQSSQNLELSPELHSWIRTFSTTGTLEGSGAVSMLNLLCFKPGMKDSYLTYGAAFAKSIGVKRGGNAKIVGSVTEVNGKAKEKGKGWDEVALAHYPSILHFADMLAAKDYQEVNKKFRVPALEDTLILCTSELEMEDLMSGGGSSSGKGSKL